MISTWHFLRQAPVQRDVESKVTRNEMTLISPQKTARTDGQLLCPHTTTSRGSFICCKTWASKQIIWSVATNNLTHATTWPGKSSSDAGCWQVLWLDCDREGENICFEVMQCVTPRMHRRFGIPRGGLRFNTRPTSNHWAILIGVLILAVAKLGHAHLSPRQARSTNFSSQILRRHAPRWSACARECGR